MSEEFVTYRRFGDAGDMQPLAAFLADNKVELSVEEASAGNLDAVYIGQVVQKDFRLKLRKEDFERADMLLQQFYQQDIDSIPPDYYLFGFNNFELMDIIAKRDEWGVLDFLLAQKILRQRGVEISEESVEELRKRRIEVLAVPQKAGAGMIVAGYAAAFSSGIYELLLFLQYHAGIYIGLYLVPMLGSIAGIFIGYILRSAKTLPNGDIVGVYQAKEQEHGKWILVLSVLMLLVWVLSRFYKYYTLQ
jgi:hypothetical protein